MLKEGLAENLFVEDGGGGGEIMAQCNAPLVEDALPIQGQQKALAPSPCKDIHLHLISSQCCVGGGLK